MAKRRTSRISLARAIRGFAGNRKGDAAMQFALVGAPFLMMVFAIVETALIFFAQQALETGTQETARLILTGQAQTANYALAQFKTALCANLASFFNCTSGIYINVQSFSSFENVTITNPVDANGNFVNNFSYSPGTAGSIVVVQTFYLWPLFVTGLGYNIGNVNGSYRLLAATTVFRNEPYS